VVTGLHQKGNAPTPPVIAIDVTNDNVAMPNRFSPLSRGRLGDDLQPILAFVAVLLRQETTDVVADVGIAGLRANARTGRICGETYVLAVE
jgi:hypothetical protein